MLASVAQLEGKAQGRPHWRQNWAPSLFSVPHPVPVRWSRQMSMGIPFVAGETPSFFKKLAVCLQDPLL